MSESTGPGMILTLLAGYIAPSLVGLAGAWILGGNRITLLLWAAVVLLLLMLINIRNAFGVVSVVVTGGIVLAEAGSIPGGTRSNHAFVSPT